MKLLIVTQYFYPENFRINELCQTLKERGYDITVLTGKPNYPKGEIFEGYTKRGHEDEVWNDIKILRCSLLPRKKGSLNLIMNYLSFVYYGRKRAKKLLHENFDAIYVFEVSPITVAFPAISLKKKTDIPIIINIQDLWPENIIAVTGLNNRFILNLIDRMVAYIYKHCDIILSASQSFVPRIQDRVIDKDKVIYWPQYSTVQKKENYLNKFDRNTFNIVFTGNIGTAQNLELVIEAAEILRNENICWHMIGDGRNKESLIQEVRDRGLDETVKFYDAVEERYVPDYLQSADVALLTLKPDPIFDLTLPAKLQTYMACGCAILGCVKGESKKVILESNAGLVCDEITSQELARKTLEFRNLSVKQIEVFKENATIYNERVFAKDNLIEQLEKELNKLRRNEHV